MGIPSRVGYHIDGSSYISQQFIPSTDNSVTVWIALDDADYENGVVEYISGSHKWTEAERQKYYHGFFGGEVPDSDKIRRPTIPAGCLAIHHENLVHGSSMNKSRTRHRRAVAVHLVNGDVKFKPKPSYIYGRYKLKDSNDLRDEFFPVTWTKSK